MNMKPKVLSRPLDVRARLEELRNLKNGWLEGGGLAPNPAALDWLANAFEKHFPDHLQLPYVFPTAEGGIQMEWSVEPNDASLEIDLNTHHGAWHCLNMITDKEITRDLDLEGPGDWNWLIEQIREMVGQTV